MDKRYRGIEVRRSMSLAERLEFYSMPAPMSGCQLWLGDVQTKLPYGRLTFKYRTRPAHVWAWEAAFGPVPNGLHVLHKCDVPGCINAAHLFLGTHQDNMADKVVKGRQLRGERHPLSRFTEAQIRQIRADSDSSYACGKRLGVSKQTILAIRNRKTWKHVA